MGHGKEKITLLESQDSNLLLVMGLVDLARPPQKKHVSKLAPSSQERNFQSLNTSKVYFTY
jgi:hypothetical protein